MNFIIVSCTLLIVNIYPKCGHAFVTDSQGSTLAVFRYPEHPRFYDGIPDSPVQ